MNWIDDEQRWLSEGESLQNAQNVIDYFGGHWSKGAIAALCGNMRHESSINPNMYEYGYDWNEDRGYGLVQWTPRSKYWNWATGAGLPQRDGDTQLARITHEILNGLQWVATTQFPYSFKQFSQSNLPVAELTEMFMWCYENPNESDGLASLPTRIEFALKVYNQLEFGGQVPAYPVNAGTPITDTFGERINPVTGEQELHNGTDWGGVLNDPIYAVMSGTIVTVGFNEFRGNWIMIKHDKDNKYSKYLHLNTVEVQQGDTVAKGQIIGGMGTTGQSTGVHLHLTITTTPEGTVDGGQYIDPEIYLANSQGGGGVDPSPSRPVTSTPNTTPQYNYEEEDEVNMYIKVKPGDTLSAIASKYGVDMNAIKKVSYHEIANKNNIVVDEVLLLPKTTPKKASSYVIQVKSGDNLSTLAITHGTTVAKLAKDNNLKHIDRIYIGQRLVVNK